MSTYVASDVLIRERSPDDDEAIVSIRNDANSDLPPITVERYRFQADPALTPPGGVQDRFVAERVGRVVGLYFLGGNWFVERPNTYIASVGVARSEWRHGIGGRLYQHLMERAKGLGAERLYGNVVSGDEHSLGFVERRGFRPDGRVGKMSRLTVADAHEDGASGIEEAIATAGIEIRTLSQIGLHDELLHRLHSVEHEIGNDIPSSEEWTQTPFDLWKKWLLEAPGHSPEHVWIALDAGNPIGLAALEMSSETVAFNGLTGVDRAYRGRGIARALKHRQIAWCRERGVTDIFTSNDVDNKRMLAINIALGYKPVPSQIELVKQL